MCKKIAIGLASLGAVAAVKYLRFIRPWYLRWGATDAEVHRPMPGDDLVPQPNHESTRAITIRTSAAEIWPWLVQMGQGRGGLYSYDWLENLIGLQFSSADRIIPEFQHLQVGDIIPLEPGGSGYRVTSIDPNRLLVLGWTEQQDMTSSWVFMLHELDGEHTRLIVRWRASVNFKMSPLVILMSLFINPVEFVMERKMLLGIKQRAERAIKSRHLSMSRQGHPTT